MTHSGRTLEFNMIDILTLTLSFTAVVLGDSCILSRDDTPTNMPVLSDAEGKIYPQSGGNGSIILSLRSNVTVSCTPASNLLENYNANEVAVECQDVGLVIVPSGQTTSYNQLGCSSRIKEEVFERETCYTGSSNVSIEFDSASGRFPLITMCHNRSAANTLYSLHTIYGSSASVAQISNARPSFKKAQFYGKVSPDTAYSQSSQLEMVKSLVRNSTLANQYINPSQSLYFARGHLSPDGDFIYVSEQNATYYFVNVVPQWQSINNGNWKAMEGAMRDLASKRGSSLKIYTGGFSTLQLKDTDNKPVDIYLARDPTTSQLVIPAPGLTWKIAHDPIQKVATVIVMVNNPHDLGVTSANIICPDLCDQIPWVTWDTKNVRKGYTYCCNISSFTQKVPYAPNLGSLKLLV